MSLFPPTLIESMEKAERIRLSQARYYCPVCGEVQRSSRGSRPKRLPGHDRAEADGLRRWCSGGPIDPDKDRAP